jgi:hypothetical protein
VLNLPEGSFRFSTRLLTSCSWVYTSASLERAWRIVLGLTRHGRVLRWCRTRPRRPGVLTGMLVGKGIVLLRKRHFAFKEASAEGQKDVRITDLRGLRSSTLLVIDELGLSREKVRL